MEFDLFKDLIFAKAKASGFTDCELYNVKGSAIMLSIPGGDQYSMKDGAALRATIGAKTGTAYTENISEKSIEYLVAAVYANAMLAEDQDVFYCEPGLKYPTIDNQAAELMDVAAVKRKREEINAAIANAPSLAKSEGDLIAISETYRLVNTRGLDIQATSHTCYLPITIIAERDRAMQNSLLYRSGPHLADIDVSSLMEEARSRADKYFGAMPLKSGKYNILYANNIASYLVQGFSVFFSATAVESGISLWKDKLSQQIANSCVSVIDDPLDINGMFTRPFDVEGLPANRKTLIEKGMLKSYLHNHVTAAQYAGAQAGNTWRLDYKYEPNIHPSNMALLPGEKSLPEMLAELGDGLYVTDMAAYFHGAGINAVSGDYSMPITGFVVRNGKIAEPFDGITVAGNLYQMMEDITQIGSDFLYGLPTSFRPGAPMGYGCYGSPSIIITNVSVGGF